MKNKFIQISNSPNLKSLLFKLPNWNYELVKIKTPKNPVFGLTSKTKDNKHILVCDYDLVDKNVVLMDIMMLRKIIQPSLVFLFTTYEDEKDEWGVIRGNYHCIILNKYFFREVEQIMKLTHSDDIHRKLANKSSYRAWVLRLSNKGEREAPKLLKVWQWKGKGQCSYAHYLLLKNLYKFKIDEKKVNFDKYTETTITFYNTSSKVNLSQIKKQHNTKIKNG